MSELKRKLALAERLAGRGKVSRRDFIQLAIATGLTVTAADALFIKAVRAEPRRGGLARFGLAHAATTDSLDPGRWPDTFTQTAFWGAGCNSLTIVNHTGDIDPDLAESFEPADGAKQWVFKLRRGVTFHDGRPVTPDDVVASFRHHMGPDSDSAAKSLLAAVTDIKADGPETVIFTLQAGNADFPYIASDYHIPIVPAKDDGSADWQSGNWTGAFKLEEFQPGVSARMTRNPNYFHDGKPYFDEVEFIGITDVAARMNALVTGDVHFIGRPDLRTLTMLQRSPNVTIVEQTGYAHYTLPMHTDTPPFDNVDVRLALKYAINREEIVQKVFLGHATSANDNPVPPGVKFAIDPEPRHTYDPERARSHLQKAGLSSLSVDLSAADAAFAGAVDAALLYRESAAAAGIDINVVRESNDGYWENVWLKKPFVACYWSGRPTVDWMFSTAYSADAAWNDTNWKNPRFNELLVAARAETDEETRAEMYSEMQQLLHTDGGVIVMVFNNLLHAHSDKLGHGELAPNWENDGLKVAERWWFTE
jgi:peptide/nickel transport system substrate-binding protein